MLTEKSVEGFLNEVASSSAAPGGGSVAALAGSLGAALVAMVCRLTIGKKKYADVQVEMEDVLNRAEELRSQLTQLIDEDTMAFNAVMQAFSLPKETEEQKAARSEAIQAATKTAALVPLKVMQLCDEAAPLAFAVAQRGNVNSASDAGVAATMLHAACIGAALNVRINLATLKDQSFVQQTTASANRILERLERSTRDVLAHVHAALQ